MNNLSVCMLYKCVNFPLFRTQQQVLRGLLTLVQILVPIVFNLGTTRSVSDLHMKEM